MSCCLSSTRAPGFKNSCLLSVKDTTIEPLTFFLGFFVQIVFAKARLVANEQTRHCSDIKALGTKRNIAVHSFQKGNVSQLAQWSQQVNWQDPLVYAAQCVLSAKLIWGPDFWAAQLKVEPLFGVIFPFVVVVPRTPTTLLFSCTVSCPSTPPCLPAHTSWMNHSPPPHCTSRGCHSFVHCLLVHLDDPLPPSAPHAHPDQMIPSPHCTMDSTPLLPPPSKCTALHFPNCWTALLRTCLLLYRCLRWYFQVTQFVQSYTFWGVNKYFLISSGKKDLSHCDVLTRGFFKPFRIWISGLQKRDHVFA